MTRVEQDEALAYYFAGVVAGVRREAVAERLRAMCDSEGVTDVSMAAEAVAGAVDAGAPGGADGPAVPPDDGPGGLGAESRGWGGRPESTGCESKF